MSPDPKTVREIATEHILDDARRAHDIGAAVLGHYGPDALTKHEYGAYCSAIREAIRTAQITVEWPDEQQQPFVADVDTPVGRIGVWLTAWKRYFGTLGLPFGADLIAGPPPSAEPRVSACDFDVVLEVLAVVLAERARSATAEQQQDGAVDLREHVRAWMDGRTDAIDRDDVREIYVVADRASRDLAGAVGELRRVLAERTALAARVAELESERNRYRIAWRRARQRARVAGWAADRYAKRSRDLHEAAMDMLTENLGLKMFGPEAVAEADRIAAPTATETEES